MSYNGSGTFVVNSTGQPVVTGTVISSTAFNALTADLATGLSTAITKDGQTTTTVRVPFAQGISSTLVTDATSATTGSIITAGGISTQKALWVGTTSRHVGATQFDAAITYGGVTLSNAVTGTGNMVLSASPTFTGAITAPQLQGPAFSAYAASNQNVSSATATKVTLGTENFDSNNCFASSRFTPTLAGYYQINAFFTADDTVSASSIVGYIYKNGSNYQTFFENPSLAGGVLQTGSVIVSMNGSTDYIELYGQVSGTAPYFRYLTPQQCCSMTGAFLRSL